MQGQKAHAPQTLVITVRAGMISGPAQLGCVCVAHSSQCSTYTYIHDSHQARNGAWVHVYQGACIYAC